MKTLRDILVEMRKKSKTPNSKMEISLSDMSDVDYVSPQALFLKQKSGEIDKELIIETKDMETIGHEFVFGNINRWDSFEKSEKPFETNYTIFNRSRRLDIVTEYTDKQVYIVQYMPIKLKQFIKDKVLPKIGGCEFQFNVVYTIIETDDFDIAVSAGYMTFEQRVTGASVSYTGEATSEAFEIFNSKYPIKVIAEKLILPKMVKVLKDNGIKINRIYNSIFNSIHRHPGKFSFSSIDTSMDADEPGVLYMTSHAENINIIDSVIYVSDDEISLIDTWHRKAFIKPDNDGKPSGKYIRYKNVTILTNIVGGYDEEELYMFSPNKFAKINKDIYTIINGLNMKFLKNIPFIVDVDKINQYSYQPYRNYNKVYKSHDNDKLFKFKF